MRLARLPRACSVGRAARGVRREQGRLAQLAEHLVYTERVGGSSPSPPTRLGLLKALSGLAGLIFFAALAPGPAAAQDHGAPMSFHVASLESHECGRHCPDVIVADGVIEAETPQAFVDFLKSGSADSELAAHRVLQFPRRQCRRLDGLRPYSARAAHRRHCRPVRRGRRPRSLRGRMPVGLRLCADGRGAPHCAPRQRGRAASHVDHRERRRRLFGRRM